MIIHSKFTIKDCGNLTSPQIVQSTSCLVCDCAGRKLVSWQIVQLPPHAHTCYGTQRRRCVEFSAGYKACSESLLRHLDNRANSYRKKNQNL